MRLAQSIVGAALCLGRTINNNIIAECNELATQKASVITTTLNLCAQLLDYLHSYLNLSITLKKSVMNYWISSGLPCLLALKGRSIEGGCYFLGYQTYFTKLTDAQCALVSALFCAELLILKSIAGAASEGKASGVYSNAREGVEFLITLIEIDYQ